MGLSNGSPSNNKDESIHTWHTVMLILLLTSTCLFGTVHGEPNHRPIHNDNDPDVVADHDLLDGMHIVLVKIGGSSITHKAKFESINQEAVSWFARSIAQSSSDIFLSSPLENQTNLTCSSNIDHLQPSREQKLGFVIVHGAGSYGHFTAKEFGLTGRSVAPPGLSADDDTMNNPRRNHEGLAKTRLSVQKLNRIVVESLINHGVNAVGISPCFSVPGLESHANLQPNAQATLETTVYQTVQAGLVPVLHGDACLYGKNGAGILSGDTIMEILGVLPWVHTAVFLTDVDGVFDRDPHKDSNAHLLPSIAVDTRTGEIVTKLVASGSSHEHDVTGGLETKMKSASTIVLAGKQVTIVKCESSSANQALQNKPFEIGSTISPL